MSQWKTKSHVAAIGMGILLAMSAQLWTPGAAAQSSAPGKPVPAVSPYIDVHSHMDISDPERAVQSALAIMAAGNAKIVFMPSPFGPDDKVAFEADKFEAAVKNQPGKMAFLAGGGTLNPMIQQFAGTPVSPETLRQFRAQAEKLLAEGAVGFGEMSAEHVPSATSPSYSAAPPDGPLFLLLADIAAEHNVVIDLHMESAPQDMPLPGNLKSPPNPPADSCQYAGPGAPAFAQPPCQNRLVPCWQHR